MLTKVSTLGLMACAIYLLVAVATTSGALLAHRHKQQRWHLYGWLALSGFFALLVVLRLVGFEDLLRDELRETLRASSTYGSRRDYQRPAAAGLLVMAALAASWWALRTLRLAKGRRNICVLVGLFGGMAMVFLMALRLISLHLIDALLYGPLKLNWIGDIGLSLLVAWAAVYYQRIVASSR